MIIQNLSSSIHRLTNYVSLAILSLGVESFSFVHAQSGVCASATPLEVGKCATFSNGENGTTSEALNCGAGTSFSDVWYQFVGNGETIQLAFSATTAGVVSLYTTCPSAANYADGTGSSNCFSTAANTQSSWDLPTNLNQTYWLRIQRTSGGNNDDQTGTICLYNHCTQASSLTVNTVCSTTDFTNNDDGAYLWDRDCGTGSSFSSIWYQIEGTGNTVSANLFNLSANDALITVYPSCPNANNADDIAIACQAITGTIGSVNFPTIVNQTYYLQILRTAGGTTGDQTGSICLFDYTLSPCGNPTALLNDYCENPATLYQNPAATFSAATAGTFTADLQTTIHPPATTGTNACSSVLQMHNNSWYSFTAQATTETFPFVFTSCQGVQGVVFEVNHNENGCCESFVRKSNCILQVPEITSAPTPSLTNTITATDLTIGQQYVLMIDGYNGAQCNFTIAGWGAINILPVELTLFTVIQFDDKNEIIWKTESEKNNAYFEVWRSYDGENFEFLQTIEGAGTSSTANFYQYSDHEIRFGDVYYKLKQVDLDGKTFESNWIYTSRTNSTEGMISVHPNPARDKATIDLNVGHNSGGTLMIYGVNGQQVYTQFIDQVGVHQVYVPVNSFEKGVYIVRYQDQANSMIKHLVVE